MSDSFPIAWHEECLRNQRIHYANKLAEFERDKRHLERMAAEIANYDSQITRAKRIGKESFDRERFKSDIELLYPAQQQGGAGAVS
jgi:hypothetical protein